MATIDAAREDTVGKHGLHTTSMSNKASCILFSIDLYSHLTAVDSDREVLVSICHAYQSGRMEGGARHRTSYFQILNICARSNEAEWRSRPIITFDIDIQHMPLSIEGSAEWLIFRSHHRGNTDVSSQFKRTVIIGSEIGRKLVPIVGAGDEPTAAGIFHEFGSVYIHRAQSYDG